jgi:hypothetical protein
MLGEVVFTYLGKMSVQLLQRPTYFTADVPQDVQGDAVKKEDKAGTHAEGKIPGIQQKQQNPKEGNNPEENTKESFTAHASSL